MLNVVISTVHGIRQAFTHSANRVAYPIVTQPSKLWSAYPVRKFTFKRDRQHFTEDTTIHSYSLKIHSRSRTRYHVSGLIHISWCSLEEVEESKARAPAKAHDCSLARSNSNTVLAYSARLYQQKWEGPQMYIVQCTKVHKHWGEKFLVWVVREGEWRPLIGRRAKMWTREALEWGRAQS